MPNNRHTPMNRPISYGELDERSDALAASLLRGRHGVGPRFCRVGVDCLPSEPAEIVALLALLKCQGACIRTCCIYTCIHAGPHVSIRFHSESDVFVFFPSPIHATTTPPQRFTSP